MSYYHENYHHTLFNTYQDWYDNYVTNLNKEPSPTEKYMAKIFFDKWYHIQGGTKMSKSAMDTPFNLKPTDSRVYWENDYYLGGYVE